MMFFKSLSGRQNPRVNKKASNTKNGTTSNNTPSRNNRNSSLRLIRLKREEEISEKN